MINPREIKIIIAKGFPFYDNDTHTENLLIKFNILFPSEIILDQKNIMKNTFEGKYMQYLRNNENKSNIININKGNWKKRLIPTGPRDENTERNGSGIRSLTAAAFFRGRLSSWAEASTTDPIPCTGNSA